MLGSLGTEQATILIGSRISNFTLLSGVRARTWSVVKTIVSVVFLCKMHFPVKRKNFSLKIVKRKAHTPLAHLPLNKRVFTCTLFPPSPLPPKFCVTCLFHFSWVLQSSKEKLKTMLMQKFGGQIRCIMGECKWRMGVVDYNLVPFSHQHQGSISLTSGKIQKKSLVGPAIKTSSSLANFFANQNLWTRLFDFDRSSVYTPILYNLKPLRKSLSQYKFMKPCHNDMSKNFVFLVIESRSMPLFIHACCMLLNLSNLQTTVLILSKKECVSSWLTNVSIPAF